MAQTSHGGHMEKDDFLDIIDKTPLVSIDLIIKDSNNRALLGYRNNHPARGFWFVPGGRIRKNETLAQAMKRIALNELGLEISITGATLLGAYDHIYNDNFDTKPGIKTHYVALGYEIKLPCNQAIKMDTQHSEIQWWSIEDLLKSEAVHRNTKAYF